MAVEDETPTGGTAEVGEFLGTLYGGWEDHGGDVHEWEEPRRESGRKPRARRRRTERELRRAVAVDLRAFHPFRGRMPRTDPEVAEEIGARLTVLAIRTHVPVRGRARPQVTLRMRHALRMLARSGGSLTVSALAFRVGTGVAAAGQLAARMAQRGLVDKERGRVDRRTRNVVLTEEGWRHVPRDERVVWEDPFAGMPVEGGRWWSEERPRQPMRRVRRVAQPPSAVEEGLRCRAVRPRMMLGQLRGVLATIHGFNLEGWEVEFRALVAARRRLRASRRDERWAVNALPRPRYQL